MPSVREKSSEHLLWEGARVLVTPNRCWSLTVSLFVETFLCEFQVFGFPLWSCNGGFVAIIKFLKNFLHTSFVKQSKTLTLWDFISVLRNYQMTQRDGMGREVGGGFRMGNTCTPVVDSCWYMAKPIQYCKVKKRKKFSFFKKRNYQTILFFSNFTEI